MIYLYAAIHQKDDDHILFGVHDQAQFQRMNENHLTHEQAAGAINDLMSSIDERDLGDPSLIEKILVWCSIVSKPYVLNALSQNVPHPHVLVMLRDKKGDGVSEQVDVSVEVFNGPDAEAGSDALAHFKSRYRAWRMN